MRSSGEQARELVVPERAGRVDHERAEDLVLRLVGSQADSLLRVARRYSLCADDAHDAYQRGLEILMHHAARLDPDRAAGWLHTVVKHEALAINRSRRRMLGSSELDLDALEARTSASPEERVMASDRVARSAEALHGLKPQEVRALWLKALGHSYEQICEATGWTYTKVNRCLAEGRKSFLERYAGIESGRECERLAPALSAFVDGEAEAEQAVQLRMHLRQCLACRAAVRGLHEASRPLTVVFPAAGLAVASGGAEQANSLFDRDARAGAQLRPPRARDRRHGDRGHAGRRGGRRRGAGRRRRRRRGRAHHVERAAAGDRAPCRQRGRCHRVRQTGRPAGVAHEGAVEAQAGEEARPRDLAAPLHESLHAAAAAAAGRASGEGAGDERHARGRGVQRVGRRRRRLRIVRVRVRGPVTPCANDSRCSWACPRGRSLTADGVPAGRV